MIVIDDLQWADASSIALYRFLAREAIGAAMVLAATVRPNEPQDVSEALADIAPRTTRWPLGGLHRSDVDSLARSLGLTSLTIAEFTGPVHMKMSTSATTMAGR